MRRYRKVGGTFFYYYYSYSSIRMCGAWPFCFLSVRKHTIPGPDIIGWPASRACVCVCVYQSWAISSRDSTSPSRRHTHTTRRTLRVHKRELVGSSERHTHDRAFFLSCLLFLFLSNGHDFLPVLHQNLFGAPNFIDAQGKIWPFIFFFFGSGREHFLGIRREIQTGHRAAVLSGIAADQSVFRFSSFLPIGRI